MNVRWFQRVPRQVPNITRTDYLIWRPYRQRLVRRSLLAIGLAEYLKKHRLYPAELEAVDQARTEGRPLDKEMAQKVRLELSEGVLGPDLQSVDDDALKGTVGQLLFRWIRENFHGAEEIIYTHPARLTRTSKACH